MAEYDDPEIEYLKNFWERYDKLTVRISVIIVIALSLVGLTLFVSGFFLLIESWEVVLSSIGVKINLFPLKWDGNLSTITIESLGLMAIGYAVFDLARSILREEIAEETPANVQDRARGFISRILSVIVVALAVDAFVNHSKYSVVSPDQLWQIAAVIIGIAALLAGWGLYIKTSSRY